MDTVVFVRQRRNLILVSFALLISLLAHVSIERINILGNEFPFEHAISASLILWPLWGYWLVRYVQAFIEEGKDKFLDACRLRFYNELDKRAMKKIMLRGDPRLNTPYMKEPGARLTAHTRTLLGSTAEGREYLFDISAFSVVEKTGSGLGRERVKFSHSEVLLSRIKAAFVLTFSTTAITEYILPFVIALAPLVCLPFV